MDQFKLEEKQRVKCDSKLPSLTDRQITENIYIIYFDVYKDSLQKILFDVVEEEVMEQHMRNLSKPKEIKPDDIYSDSEECEGCKDCRVLQMKLM